MAEKKKSFDDGHGYITFGWIATIIGCLLFFPAMELYNSNENNSSKYAQKCADEYKNFSAPAAEVNPLSSHNKPHQSNDEKKQDPDWCDLAAQHSMAKSTVSLKWAAWVTVTFTAIGMFLIARTLVQTSSAANFAAQALEEAGKTTAAAIAGAEQATRAADFAQEELELSKSTARPILMVDEIKSNIEGYINGTENQFRFDFIVKNFGQNLAILRDISIFAMVGEKFEPERVGIHMMPREGRMFPFSNTKVLQSMEFEKRWDVTSENTFVNNELSALTGVERSRKAMLDMEAFAWLVVKVEYEDAFFNKMTTSMCIRQAAFSHAITEEEAGNMNYRT